VTVRALLLLAAASVASAVELRIQFAALERMLTEQVFTQEGRRYVRGDKANKCNFAYLEKPEVRGENGQLRIRAKFSGRSSLNMLGQCVGLGDAFDVVIAAVPQYRDGYLRLAEVKVASDHKTGYYIRRVCTALEASLVRDFRYQLELEARKTLEAPDREFRKFNVPEIRVTNDALVLVVDFELTVK
jgi:hypothetical protein